MTPGRLLYLVRRRLRLGYRHWVAERFLLRKIEQQKIRYESDSDLTVYLLVCKHDWQLALWMLASLQFSIQSNCRVVLHEDGSMTEGELDSFHEVFKNLRIVRKADADRRMLTRLASYPRCRDYRDRMPHGRKVFDIPQLAEDDRFLMIDPDVIFYNAPTELIDWQSGKFRGCWFNQDFQEPSPISPEDARTDLGVSLWPQVNSGLCLLERETICNLDLMESWLADTRLQDPAVQWRVEQTLIALAASASGKGGLLPPSYEVSSSKHRSQNCIARHYVGCVRDRFLSEGVYDMARKLLK